MVWSHALFISTNMNIWLNNSLNLVELPFLLIVLLKVVTTFNLSTTLYSMFGCFLLFHKWLRSYSEHLNLESSSIFVKFFRKYQDKRLPELLSWSSKTFKNSTAASNWWLTIVYWKLLTLSSREISRTKTWSLISRTLEQFWRATLESSAHSINTSNK